MTDFMPMGGEMHPVSRMPAEAERRGDAAAKEKSESTRLHDQAEFLSVAESRAAELLMDLIENELHVLFSEFLRTSPKGQVCHNILNAFYHNRNLAQNAVKKLMAKGGLY